MNIKLRVEYQTISLPNLKLRMNSMSLLDSWREKRKEGKERREEHGQLGALKMALSEGKEEIADEFEDSGLQTPTNRARK